MEQETISDIKIYILETPKNGCYYSFSENTEGIVGDMIASMLDMSILERCKTEYQKEYIYGTGKVKLYEGILI